MGAPGAGEYVSVIVVRASSFIWRPVGWAGAGTTRTVRGVLSGLVPATLAAVTAKEYETSAVSPETSAAVAAAALKERSHVGDEDSL